MHRNEMFLTTHSGSRLFCKKYLAEALSVTRPTLDRWITNGWLEGCTVRAFSNDEKVYSADAVRRALERLRLDTRKRIVSEGDFIESALFYFVEIITLHIAVKMEKRGRPLHPVPRKSGTVCRLSFPVRLWHQSGTIL